MLAWVQRGPSCRYTTALTEPHVPIGGCWRPPGTSEVKQLPSFPDALANWPANSSRGSRLYVPCVRRLRPYGNLQSFRNDDAHGPPAS